MKKKGIQEIHLQERWNSCKAYSSFRTTDNAELEIISPGSWNKEAGPDFLNAKIKLDNRIITGDIEIHNNTSDWYKHGHQNNPDYDDVILHVVSRDDSGDEKRPDIPTLELAGGSAGSRERKGRCVIYFSTMEERRLTNMFLDAGLERFHAKADRFLKRMLESGTENAFIRGLFDTAGYKNNRDNFAELFARFSEYTEEERNSHPEAILFGEAGLLPDVSVVKLSEEMRVFTKECWGVWWQLRRTSRETISWKRNSTRPASAPERRIAALSIILSRTGIRPLMFFIKQIESSTPDNFWKSIEKNFCANHELWDSFNSFTCERKIPGAVSGRQWALEVAVNAVLPAIYAWATLEKRPEIKEFAEKAWLALPPTSDNAVTRRATERWFADPERAKAPFASAPARQGVIHLFREYCEGNQADCSSCKIYNSINT